MKIKIFIAFVLGAAILFIAAKDKQKNQNQITANDDYNYIAINNCMMWVSNNGDGSHDPRRDASGFYWPIRENPRFSSIFEDGLVFGGIVNGVVKVNGNTHRQGLQAGKILDDGTPDDPGLEKYRIYKIRKNWEFLPPGIERDSYEKDYNEWPVEDGAPWIDVDGDGVFTRGVDEPEFIGDETLWYVSNDMDPARSTFTYGSLPIGLEFQVTVFAFDRANMLGDAVFKRYKIINRSGSEIKDMYFSYWSDPDLGNAGDDFVGCDTVFNIGYCYNGDDDDEYFYGFPPPAVGYNFFERPTFPSPGDSALVEGEWIEGYKNIPFSSFILIIGGNYPAYRDPQQGVYEGTLEFYNLMQGKTVRGDNYIDPNTGKVTTYVCAGDPVSGTGWYQGDGWPGGPPRSDMRLIYNSGPINFEPADTQNVLVGLFMAKGKDRVWSIAELRRQSAGLQTLAENNFEPINQVVVPKLNSNVLGKTINLHWDTNAESYTAKDFLYTGEEIEDTLYKFEGYRLWQYKNSKGEDPLLIGIFDLKNGIESVYGFQTVNGARQFVKLFNSPNEGIINSFTVAKDYYNETELRYEKDYYFGVTAYAYLSESKEPFLESESNIVKVRLKKEAIDYSYNGENLIIPEHAEGSGDAYIRVKIVDPSQLTGDEYKIVFDDSVYAYDENNWWVPKDSLVYSLINITSGDTLLKNRTDFVRYLYDEYSKPYIPEGDTTGKPVIEGFQLLISRLYADSLILNNRTKYYVRDVKEIKGPGGTPLEEPANVWDNPSPNGGWYVTAKGDVNRFIWQKAQQFEGLGFNDYEIRFDRESQFYATGYVPSFWPQLQSDPLGKGTVPFSVWDIGQTPDDPSDDKQLLIKVLDFAWGIDGLEYDSSRVIPDSIFSQLDNGNWEEIYVFRTDLDFNDLPETSPRFEATDSPFGAFVFNGDLPRPGTVIRLSSVKHLSTEDVYTFNTTAANLNDTKTAKEKIDEITVFPNPYYAPDQIAMGDEKVTFARLPNKVKIRIYSLSGHLVKRLDKDDNSERLDWFLNNDSGESVNNGIYIAHLEMEGIGEKIIKIAVVK